MNRNKNERKEFLNIQAGRYSLGTGLSYKRMGVMRQFDVHMALLFILIPIMNLGYLLVIESMEQGALPA